MAPKRKPRNSNKFTSPACTRVTQSSICLANAIVAPPTADPKPQRRKKAKTATTTKKEVETETELPPSPEEQEQVSKWKTIDNYKTLIIEHYEQSNSFKTRAIQVNIGLEKDVKGVKVLVNPEKPRMGYFEIREESEGNFVSLMNMKRPFKPINDLDKEKIIYDIV